MTFDLVHACKQHKKDQRGLRWRPKRKEKATAGGCEPSMSEEFAISCLRWRTAAQDVPTVFRKLERGPRFELVLVRRSESLGGSPEDFLKLPTEMRFVGEFQFSDDSLVGIALCNELFRQATLQISKPVTGSAM